VSNVSVFNPSKVPAFARNNVLSETALALTGGGSGAAAGKRISIKGGVFRLMDNGKEVAAIEDRHLDIIIVKAAPKVGRQYYAGAYDKDAAASAPDCTSNDGERPDPSSKNKQSETCLSCPQNQAGSGTGNSRACRYQQRLAVVLANDMEGSVMQMVLPATSIFGKAEGDKHPLQSFARYLAAQNPPINPEQIVTRMKFDTKSESPKLHFAPTRWLTDDEYDVIKDQADSDDAKKAIVMNAASTDGAKAAPLAIAGKPPAKAAPAPEPTPEEDDEEVAARLAVAKPPKKPKFTAAPAPVVEEEEDTAPEPEVRKAPSKANAVPATKASLADIVSDWDDE
jgi:hypothetical protein